MIESQLVIRLGEAQQASRDAWETAKVMSRRLEDLVAQADAAGASAREISQALGVSPTRVYAIIRAGYGRDENNDG